MFRCQDLETYVKEVDSRKKNLLLINKADMMTEKQRKAWADYFDENGIDYTFFSALASQEQELEDLYEDEESDVNVGESENENEDENEGEEQAASEKKLSTSVSNMQLDPDEVAEEIVGDSDLESGAPLNLD